MGIGRYLYSGSERYSVLGVGAPEIRGGAEGVVRAGRIAKAAKKAIAGRGVRVAARGTCGSECVISVDVSKTPDRNSVVVTVEFAVVETSPRGEKCLRWMDAESVLARKDEAASVAENAVRMIAAGIAGPGRRAA